MFFWFKEGWPQLFLIWVSCWKLIRKIILCWGNCCQFGEQFQCCLNQPDLANLPRQLKTHIAFSMFPILDTNLWPNYTNLRVIERWWWMLGLFQLTNILSRHHPKARWCWWGFQFLGNVLNYEFEIKMLLFWIRNWHWAYSNNLSDSQICLRSFSLEKGVSEEVLAVGFCLGSGLFGSCNSD